MFKCLRCGKCCENTQMILTKSDIERICKLGYRLEDFAQLNEEGYYVLKNVQGHCVFLDIRTKKCKIYPCRPLGCRLYPIIYIKDENVVTVDKECLASGTVTVNDIVKSIPLLLKVLDELNIRYDLGKLKIVL